MAGPPLPSYANGAPLDGMDERLRALLEATHRQWISPLERRRMRATVGSLDPGGPARSWQSAEERILIADALGRLPAAQRAVLTFVALDDLPVREVARLMGKSLGATQSLLARAREGFRRAYPREIEP